MSQGPINPPATTDPDNFGDYALPEDAAILAVLPLNGGRLDLYREAMRLVGATHSKAKFTELVNWLLHEREAAMDAVRREEQG